MRYSPESLQAFIQTVVSGSFSAAARALSKSQSTISVAIAKLEDDLGVQLFDRQTGQPVLTEAGQQALSLVHDIVAASQRLEELSRQLSNGVESRLTLAISDIWPAASFEKLLRDFEQHYSHVNLECITAEDADIIGLIQNGRASLGLLRHQTRLPPQLSGRMLPVSTELNIWIKDDHPLARLSSGVTLDKLNTVRQLRLETLIQSSVPQGMGKGWSASSYLLLLDMAQKGFGWSILPDWLVAEFGDNSLVPLAVPGYPKKLAMDVIWSSHHLPGPAGYWVVEQLSGSQINQG